MHYYGSYLFQIKFDPLTFGFFFAIAYHHSDIMFLLHLWIYLFKILPTNSPIIGRSRSESTISSSLVNEDGNQLSNDNFSKNQHHDNASNYNEDVRIGHESSTIIIDNRSPTLVEQQLTDALEQIRHLEMMRTRDMHIRDDLIQLAETVIGAFELAMNDDDDNQQKQQAIVQQQLVDTIDEQRKTIDVLTTKVHVLRTKCSHLGQFLIASIPTESAKRQHHRKRRVQSTKNKDTSVLVRG